MIVVMIIVMVKVVEVIIAAVDNGGDGGCDGGIGCQKLAMLLVVEESMVVDDGVGVGGANCDGGGD